MLTWWAFKVLVCPKMHVLEAHLSSACEWNAVCFKESKDSAFADLTPSCLCGRAAAHLASGGPALALAHELHAPERGRHAGCGRRPDAPN
jgi:hypothetical protein